MSPPPVPLDDDDEEKLGWRGVVGGGGDCFYRGRERVVVSARAVC